MSAVTDMRPLPQPTPWSLPFWEGTRQHELRIQRCSDCRKAIFFPKKFCPHCLSRNVAWERANGRGTIYSFTVVRNNPPSPFMRDVPFVIAIVTLDEGVRMMTNIVQCDPEKLRCDQPVEVVFDDDRSAEISIPMFRPL